MTLPAFLQQAPPAVAVDIAPGRVAVARVERRGAGPVAGRRTPSRRCPTARSPARWRRPTWPTWPVVAAAVERALRRRRAATRGRVCLVVPDSIARVSIVRFETVPARAADLEELIRWQIKKTTPFPLDEAVVAFTPGRRAGGGHEFVVSVARRDVVAQYEAACAARRLPCRGRRPGDASTSSTRCWPPTGRRSGDWLLVHAAASYVSLAVLRDGHLIFYRTRGEESEGSIADLVHQTAMYYEDRLKRPALRRACCWPAGRPAPAPTTCGTSCRIGSGSMSRRSIRSRRRRRTSAGRRRRWPTCWPPASACCCAKGRRPSHAARQPGDAAVLQRAPGARACWPRRWPRRRRGRR